MSGAGTAAVRRRERGGPARCTKIVCTIGPSSWSEQMLGRLARAGMDVGRLNFSYGTWEEHGRVIGRIRKVAEKLGRPIGILQDLAGPKLRVGELPEGGMTLRPRQEVVLSVRAPGRVRRTPEGWIPVPVPGLPGAVSAGQRLLLSDGQIELEALDSSGTEIRCKVRVGGVLKSHQGLNLPEASLPIPTVTEKDLADLRFGLAQGVDWVAMSFVRRAEDLAPLRRVMEEEGRAVGLIAKIEKHEAVGHLEEIIAAADGVMVARGDLGIEVPLDRVPILQKQIIAACRRAGKPVITATQMLESMVSSPRPTRAEVSDVANAVFDGTDAVMLSGETAAGRYPAEAVKVMARVTKRAEGARDFEACLAESARWPCRTVTDAIGQATCALAKDLGARTIITGTSTGHTAAMVAIHRPDIPIVAVTANVATERRLTLVWGVRPLVAPRGRNTDELIVNAVGRAMGARLVKPGDRVVVTAGVPAGVPGQTNLIKVEIVGKHQRV